MFFYAVTEILYFNTKLNQIFNQGIAKLIREVYENNWSKATQIREGVENSKI